MTKQYNLKKFQISKNIYAECWSENTAYGFRHLAELNSGYTTIETAKACYYNRTWECYEFQSVLKNLLSEAKKSGSLSAYYIRKFDKLIENNWKIEDQKETDKKFGMIGSIASLGSIFSNTQKEANDWKARMLKAGLTGLDLPEDWETLSEEVKTARLDQVINSLTQ